MELDNKSFIAIFFSFILSSSTQNSLFISYLPPISAYDSILIPQSEPLIIPLRKKI